MSFAVSAVEVDTSAHAKAAANENILLNIFTLHLEREWRLVYDLVLWRAEYDSQLLRKSHIRYRYYHRVFICGTILLYEYSQRKLRAKSIVDAPPLRATQPPSRSLFYL